MQNKLILLEGFLEHLKKNNYSDETIYNYERDLKTFQKFLKMNHLEIESIKEEEIEKFKLYLFSESRKTTQGKESDSSLSVSSVNRMLSSLRSYLRYIRKKSSVELNISFYAIKLLRGDGRAEKINVKLNEKIKLIEFPSQFEKNKVVALRNRAMLEVLFSTGIRISELINLKINNIGKKGKILIRKNKGGERFAYLTPRAKRSVENYLNFRGNPRSSYLFVPYRGKNASKKDKKISPNYLQYKIKQYRELLGLNKPISARDLRHSYVSYLAETITSPDIIGKINPHKSVKDVNHYTSIPE